MAAANQSLDANRKLVGKLKESRFSFIHTSTEKTEYDLPKASPEALKRIQNKLERENKSRKQKRLLLIGVLAILLVFVFNIFSFVLIKFTY
ncbi:MAG: hypothetical protein QNK89_10670 [Lacinutrix sp.]|uniref:hypothetical protein n=1 Tax=Lacinutrix sp. TaxID=1937692 RepID=UPI00309C3BED